MGLYSKAIGKLKRRVKNINNKLPKALKEYKVKVWKTKDGRELPVSKMTDSHLINTIKMCRRNCNKMIHTDQEQLMGAEAFLSGEMALDSIDSCLDYFDSEFFDEEEYLEERVKGYKWVKEEASKRKLEI